MNQCAKCSGLLNNTIRVRISVVRILIRTGHFTNLVLYIICVKKNTCPHDFVRSLIHGSKK
jgi:hypothetical protein